ncbi:MAG: hypothetical protein AAGE84_00860 [Cyanobacteria bacterium P01_G01_bin.39]
MPTLPIIAAKAPTQKLQLQFSLSAQDMITVEQGLHEEFFAKFGITSEIALSSQPYPTYLNYTNFLLATAYQHSFAIAIAAVMPCFLIYLEGGKHIYPAGAEFVNQLA